MPEHDTAGGDFMRDRLLLAFGCFGLGVLLMGTVSQSPTNRNGHAKRILVGEQRSAVKSPGHQVFDWMWGWSKPGTGENSPKGKTNHSLSEHYYVKQAEGQSGGVEALRVWCPAPGDCVARAATVFGLAPTNSTGDEGNVIARLYSRDYYPVPTGRFAKGASLRKGDTQVRIHVSRNNAWGAVGEDNLLVFTAPSRLRRVEVARYQSPTWTVADPGALAGVAREGRDETGWCFALEGSRYDDGAEEVLDWLPVVAGPGDPGCDGTCRRNQLATLWLGQGQAYGAPPVGYTPGANARSYGGSAVLAPCERITDVEHEIDPDSGGFAGFQGTLTLRPARHATAGDESAFQIHTGGPPHIQQGINVRVEKRRGAGMLATGVSVTNGATQPGVGRKMEYGFATHGVGRTAQGYHFDTAFRARSARNGLEYTFEKADPPADNSVLLVRTRGTAYGKERYPVIRFGKDRTKKLEFDSATGRWLLNGQTIVTASGDAGAPLLFGARAGVACRRACQEHGLRCAADATFAMGSSTQTSCVDTRAFRLCGCY